MLDMFCALCFSQLAVTEKDKNSNQKDGETAKPKYKRKENKKQKT